MTVLYPEIVNAYTKFAQHCVYYKRNFSVLPRKHHSACEIRTEPVLSRYSQVGSAMYHNTYYDILSNQLSRTERVRIPCVFRKQSGVLF